MSSTLAAAQQGIKRERGTLGRVREHGEGFRVRPELGLNDLSGLLRFTNEQVHSELEGVFHMILLACEGDE